MQTFTEMLVAALEVAQPLNLEQANEITEETWNAYEAEHVGGRPSDR